MILGFKPQFQQPIEKGIKIHTLRHDSTERWQAGMQIHMATGVRTSNYNCFNDKHYCKGIQGVKFRYSNIDGFEVFVDGKKLNNEQLNLLAKNDGFTSLRGLKDWFIPLIENNYGVLNQRLIHWTDLRY